MDIEQIIREYIDKSVHLSLATVADNKPWVCEVHFVYDEDLNIYWRSLPSSRHSLEITNNPKVSGNIVKQHQLGEIPHGIYFEGTAEQVESEDGRLQLFPLFQQRLGSTENILEEAQNPKGHQFYKITVSNWYTFGKFDSDSVSKQKIEWNKSV